MNKPTNEEIRGTSDHGTLNHKSSAICLLNHRAESFTPNPKREVLGCTRGLWSLPVPGDASALDGEHWPYYAPP